MKPIRFVAAAVVFAVVACSSAPTEPAVFDATPSFSEDGGAGLGSGNFYGGGSGDGFEGDATTQSDSTGRGGASFGSGT
jgi:hypothetical protein